MSMILVKPHQQIKKNSETILDWQKRYKQTSVTINPYSELTYFFIQGADNAQPRVIQINLKKGSSLKLFGISVGTGTTELKADILINHEDSESTSRIILKGIFTDESRGLLNGVVHIKPKAQRSDARLEERVLILSENAFAKTIPNLEIEANDVKASHAATISKISEEEIFYLQARGIRRERAYSALVKGFISSQLQALPDKKVHDKILTEINESLS